VTIESKILEIIGRDRSFESDLPYEEEEKEYLSLPEHSLFNEGVLVVQKMPNAPSERSVNRGGGGFRRGQTLHAMVLSDSLKLGRTTRVRGEFLCSSANRSKGFDVFGHPDQNATCNECLAKIERYSIRIETSKTLSGYRC
jgi:hypothetical protein